MAIIGNDSDSFLHGLSDFWLRYFKDVGDLKGLYEGTEILMGQAYLNLLSDVLNASVVETPLFKKQYYHLITLRQDELESTAGGWVYTSKTTYGKLPTLQNKVFAATAALEESFDYTVDGNKITFKSNPFTPTPLNGYGYRVIDGVGELAFWAVDAEVDEFDLYYRFGHFFSAKTRSSETYRTFIRGIMQLYLLGPAIERIESALNVVAGLPVVREDGELVTSIDDGVSAMGNDGALFGDRFQSAATYFGPTAVGGYISITNGDSWNLNTYPVLEVLGNGHELRVGAPVDFQGTTWPGFNSETGTVWEFSSSGKHLLVTDRHTYVLPRGIALRPDIGVGTPLTAFEPLTDAVRVTDYISDPEWWHHITIPENLYTAPLESRISSPDPVIGKIGATSETGYAKIGDPGFTIGPADGFHWDDALQAYVDEVLDVPAEPLPRYRQRAAFVIMDRFLKMHIFGVTIDQRLGLSAVEMLTLLREVKPTHTSFYFKTGVRFTDLVLLDDSSTLGWLAATLRLMDDCRETPTNWKVGQLKVGGGYRFDPGFIPTAVYPVTPSDTPLIVGGPNPTVIPQPGEVVEMLKLTTTSLTPPNPERVFIADSDAGAYVEHNELLQDGATPVVPTNNFLILASDRPFIGVIFDFASVYVPGTPNQGSVPPNYSMGPSGNSLIEAGPDADWFYLNTDTTRVPAGAGQPVGNKLIWGQNGEWRWTVPGVWAKGIYDWDLRDALSELYTAKLECWSWLGDLNPAIRKVTFIYP